MEPTDETVRAALEAYFGVRGRTAVVTGGTRGIGRIIAEAYVRAGMRVIVASRKADAVAQTVEALSRLGRCEGFPANLATESGCAELADRVRQVTPVVHVLVNNAGATWGAPFADYDEAAWDRVLDLNVKGVFQLTRHLHPLLDAAAGDDDPARVVNIGSIDGIQVPMLETYAYSASKAAVHHLTRHLARRLAPRITVNALAPGPFESKMMAETLRTFGEQIAASAPMRRIGRPADLAGAAIWLASPSASYVTGAVIPVDGGIATCR
jgi:NAD(P)-dependent dehydrogenase (short-subunit alcohol dehydrogenase family)